LLIGLLALLVGGYVLLLVLHWHRPSESGKTTTTQGTMEAGENVELPGAAGPPCESNAACAETALCTRRHCVTITASTTECREVLIRFARGTSTVTPSAEDEVARAARCFRFGREPTIAIEPSTDPTRSREENDALTKARELSVRQAIERLGVAPERLEPKR
jgi:outer membrane protein OmpA-like peptidoglycan-associated protein